MTQLTGYGVTQDCYRTYKTFEEHRFERHLEVCSYCLNASKSLSPAFLHKVPQMMKIFRFAFFGNLENDKGVQWEQLDAYQTELNSQRILQKNASGFIYPKGHETLLKKMGLDEEKRAIDPLLSKRFVDLSLSRIFDSSFSPDVKVIEKCYHQNFYLATCIAKHALALPPFCSSPSCYILKGRDIKTEYDFICYYNDLIVERKIGEEATETAKDLSHQHLAQCETCQQEMETLPEGMKDLLPVILKIIGTALYGEGFNPKTDWKRIKIFEKKFFQFLEAGRYFDEKGYWKDIGSKEIKGALHLTPHGGEGQQHEKEINIKEAVDNSFKEYEKDLTQMEITKYRLIAFQVISHCLPFSSRKEKTSIASEKMFLDDVRKNIEMMRGGQQRKEKALSRKRKRPC